MSWDPHTIIRDEPVPIPKGQRRLMIRRARELFPDLNLGELRFAYRVDWECRHCRSLHMPMIQLWFEGNTRVTLCTDRSACDFRASVRTSS